MAWSMALAMTGSPRVSIIMPPALMVARGLMMFMPGVSTLGYSLTGRRLMYWSRAKRVLSRMLGAGVRAGAGKALPAGRLSVRTATVGAAVGVVGTIVPTCDGYWALRWLLPDAVILHCLPPGVADIDRACGVGMGIVTAKMLTFEQRLKVDKMAVYRTVVAGVGKGRTHLCVQMRGSRNYGIEAVDDVLGEAQGLDCLK